MIKQLPHNTRLLRGLTADPDTRIHASLAGGRKTMSFYMGYAMSLLGREQDELSHVLISPPALENSPDFWWKPTGARLVRTGGSGEPCSTEDAVIDVAPIPFARLRYLMSQDLFIAGNPKRGIPARFGLVFDPHQIEIIAD